jgi:hypothetical protein
MVTLRWSLGSRVSFPGVSTGLVSRKRHRIAIVILLRHCKLLWNCTLLHIYEGLGRNALKSEMDSSQAQFASGENDFGMFVVTSLCHCAADFKLSYPCVPGHAPGGSVVGHGSEGCRRLNSCFMYAYVLS